MVWHGRAGKSDARKANTAITLIYIIDINFRLMKVLKGRITVEDNQLVTNCYQLILNYYREIF